MLYRILISLVILLSLHGFTYSQNVKSPVRNMPEKRIGATERGVRTAIEAEMRCAGLVEVSTVYPGIAVLLRYSGSNNVWNTDMYGNFERAYLHPVAASRLAKAQQMLAKEHPGYRLLIWDAARPLHIQQEMWDRLDKPEGIKHWYVANPQRGSLHNYGMAVDLTIQDEKGRLLDMGTDFDYFGHPAYSNMEAYYEQTGQLTKTQAENRRYLANLMRRAGFSPSSTEWWHYNACSVAEAKARYTIVR